MRQSLGRAIDAYLMFWTGLRSCCLFASIVLLLTAFGACTALGFGVAQVAAAPAQPPAYDVMLVVDQSQSLFDLGGRGSDPDMLRMAGARLFASRLGIDETRRPYRLGVVYFGSDARLILPLTPLDGPEARAAARRALVRPSSMGWTDVDAALALATTELRGATGDPTARQPVVVLFTDGRPQTSSLDDRTAQHAYLERLERRITTLTGRGAQVFTILLRSPAVDTDRYTRTVYRPFWLGLAESATGVRFYEVRGGADLMDAYRDVLRTLNTAAPPTVTATAAVATVTATATTTVPALALEARPTPSPAGGPPIGPPVPDREGRSVLPVLVGLGALAVVSVGGGLALRSRRRQPVVEGALRLVRAPQEGPDRARVGRRWDLGAMRRVRVVVGRAAELPVVLAGGDVPQRAAAIVSAPEDVGTRGVMVVDLTADSVVRLNGSPVGQGRPLAHGDTIAVGDYVLRYENVRLRRNHRGRLPRRRP